MEMDELKNYHDDIDVSALPAELQILRTICADGEVSNFDDITKQILMKSKEERGLIRKCYRDHQNRIGWSGYECNP